MNQPGSAIIQVKDIPHLHESVFRTSRRLISATYAASCCRLLVNLHIKYLFIWHFGIEQAEVSCLSCIGDLRGVVRVPTDTELNSNIPLKRFDFVDDLISWIARIQHFDRLVETPCE